MYNTQSRLALVHARVEQRKKRQRDGRIVKLSILCCGLLALDIAVMAGLDDPIHYQTPERWMYGATLLPSNAGGYVLVAVITFVVAVTITILCMNYREKGKQQEEQS